MQAQLELVFAMEDGRMVTKVFTTRPLGLQFRTEMPIVIMRVQEGSQAEELGVELGWKVHSIDEKLLDGMTIDQVYQILRKSSAPLRCNVLVRHLQLQATSVESLSAKLKSVAETEVVPFLEQFGFAVQNARSWGNIIQKSRLRFWIHGHREMGFHTLHTWYAIMGEVIGGDDSSRRHWMVERRLAHVRALMHHPVKSELGNDYNHYFREAHFARRGGLPGTTSRMQSWLAALSKAIHSGAVSPALVTDILCFLEAPARHEVAGQTIPGGELLYSNASKIEGGGAPTGFQCVKTRVESYDCGKSGEAACNQDVPDDETDQGTDDGREGLLEDCLDELDSTDELPAQAESMPEICPMTLSSF